MHVEVEQELIQSGAVSFLDIQFAKQEGRKSNSSILINLLATRTAEASCTVTKILAQYYKIPLISLNKVTPPPKLMKLCKAEQARKLYFLPISEQGSQVVVGMVDPIDLNLVDAIRAIYRKSIQPVFISKDDFERNFYRFFRQGIERPAESESLMDTIALKQTALGSEQAETADKSVAAKKFASQIISKALASGASALYIEPQQDESQISLMIDGGSYDLCKLSTSNHKAIVTAVMELAQMNTSQTGMDQRSRRHIKFHGQEYTLIYRITPTPNGERVSVYIIDARLDNLTLENLGLQDPTIEQIKTAFKGPGIFLITGDAGSGKSTTLQAFVRYAATLNVHTFTIEDIVRQKISGIQQLQIKPGGPSKSAILNSLLSRKVDIVIIDEADKEVLPVAVEAASKGCLVLLCLSAAGIKEALSRLLCSEISRSRLAPSMKLIYNQRIIRKLCPSCKTTATLHPATIEQWKVPKSLPFRSSRGCDTCNQTGYQGTMLLAELLPFNEKLELLVNQGASGPEIVEAARYQGMLTLFEQGINRAIDGITSLEEVLATLPCDEPFEIRSRMKYGRIMPMRKDAFIPEPKAAAGNIKAEPAGPSVSLPSAEAIKPSAEESRPSVSLPSAEAIKPPAKEDHSSITFSDMIIPAAEKPVAVKEEEKPADSSSAPVAEQEKGNVESPILLVDDSQVTRDLTRHILEMSGYFRVDTAGTASKALEMLQQKQYHLVITDQEMPEQTGQEFIESIRQHPSLNSVGTILLTGNLSEMSALEGGADGYISKPTDPELLVARAKSISDIYRRLSGIAPLQSRPVRKMIPGKTAKVEFTDTDMSKISNFELDGTMNNALPQRQAKEVETNNIGKSEDEAEFDSLFK
ncbi:MAG: Flp pilus assembly complex ATPase component TadA [Mariprofundaceae bacterium]|nr:Flp pilus assembly complex ATPase component TadA [Mariprofundaceae bacterium]